LRSSGHGAQHLPELRTLVPAYFQRKSPMNPQDAIDLGREAIITALVVGSPILLAGVVIGLLIGLIQAVTQIQDQTLSFVPKIIAMIGVLAICLPWLIERMMEYSQDLITNIPTVVLGG
jgi:flagellar biosynthetic protein FliQ